jgi:hypothetical protein
MSPLCAERCCHHHIDSSGIMSLGANGAKPQFVSADKKKNKRWIFKKQFIHCIYNLL